MERITDLPFGLNEWKAMIGATFISVVVLMIYMPIANRLNIIDKPNQRSSHTTPIILGGGVLYPIVIALGALIIPNNYPLFILGIVLLAIVSFIDDRRPLPSVFRLSIHLIAVIGMLVSVNLWNESLLLFAICLILVIGWINTFNFMDGINGITALYALSIMLASYVAYEQWGREFEVYPFAKWILILGIGATLAFSFFNVRKRARCFAGDVGSVSLALILAFVVLPLIIFVNLSFVGFLLIYGVDSLLTIFHRIKKKENILEAHRSHLYQYLANEMKWGHLPVSFLYFILQMFASSLLIAFARMGMEPLIAFSIVAVPFSTAYIISRVFVLKKIETNSP